MTNNSTLRSPDATAVAWPEAAGSLGVAMSEPQPSPASPASSGPSGRRVPPMLVISVTIGSIALSVLIATWLVGNDTKATSIGPQQMLNIEAAGGVQVSGTAQEGAEAPVASFPLLDGGSMSLTELRGSPVVLNFWASTCVPCKQEMAAFEKVHAESGDRVRFIGIDVSESTATGKKFAKQTGVSYTLGRDPQSKMITAFGGIALPHTVIIDAKGTINAIRNRALDEAALRQLVADVTP